MQSSLLRTALTKVTDWDVGSDIRKNPSWRLGEAVALLVLLVEAIEAESEGSNGKAHILNMRLESAKEFLEKEKAILRATT